MVSGYAELRELELGQAVVAASDYILALHQIDAPTREQRLGALLEAEYKLTVIQTLSRFRRR